MSSGAVSYGRGRIIAGQYDMWFTPRVRTRRYPVIMTHGYQVGGFSSTGWNSPTSPGMFALIHALADAGAVVILSQVDGNSFGNDAAVSDIETIRTYASNFGSDTSKVVAFGGSMGGNVWWNYMRAYGDKVAGAALIAPLTDLNGAYQNGISSLPTIQDDIAAAWGVTRPSALPARADPLSNASTIASFNVPTVIYYSSSSNDGTGDGAADGSVVVPTSTLTSMQTALGSACQLLHVSTTAHHSDAEVVAALNFGLISQLLTWAT